MNVVLIPARGGSKRIPRKNIKHFHGKPIIAHVIERALASGCIDRVIVSTDDVEIAEVAKKYGAEVPFMRPPEFADDFATTSVVIEHAIKWLSDHQQKPDYMCVIYPTAPFITSENLKESLSVLQQTPSKKFCFGVCEFPSPIQRSFSISEKGEIAMFQPEHFNTRSQDLERAFFDAGQFYWGTTDDFLSGNGMFTPDAIPFLLPLNQVQDIDTLEDWQRAELIFKVMQESHV